MKKKLLSVVLTASMIVSLAGCSGSNGDTPSTTDQTQQTQSSGSSDTAPADTTPAAADTQTPADSADTNAEPVTLKWAIWDKESTSYWQALADAY